MKYILQKQADLAMRVMKHWSREMSSAFQYVREEKTLGLPIIMSFIVIVVTAILGYCKTET